MAKDRQGTTIYPNDLVDYHEGGSIHRAVVYTIQPDGRVQINTEEGKTLLVDSSSLLIIESLISPLYDQANKDALEAMIASTANLPTASAEKKPRASRAGAKKTPTAAPPPIDFEVS